MNATAPVLSEGTVPVITTSGPNPWVPAAQRLADDRALSLTHPKLDSVLIGKDGAKLDTDASKKATALKYDALITAWQKAGAEVGVSIKKTINDDGSVTFWAIDRITRTKPTEPVAVTEPVEGQPTAS